MSAIDLVDESRHVESLVSFLDGATIVDHATFYFTNFGMSTDRGRRLQAASDAITPITLNLHQSLRYARSVKLQSGIRNELISAKK